MTSKRWRILLLALLGCGLVWAVAPGIWRLTPAGSPLGVKIKGGFAHDGEFPGEPFAGAAGLRRWGSWMGSDTSTGRLTVGPCRAPAVLRLYVSGYPNVHDNELFAELVATKERLRITTENSGERWKLVEFTLPAEWRDRPMVLVAVDGATGWGGWLGVSEPLGVRSSVSRIDARLIAEWIVAGLALSAAVVAALRRRKAVLPPAGIAASVRDWCRDPRLTGWVVLGFAVLLFLRKPHALHTPQLWAEDGSIFLAFNDLLGGDAFLMPYMGYLHTLPRLIAWSASQLLDPAWWPAFYNGVSFLICLAIVVRMMSPWLDLPWKPFLALAFFVGANTGEVLFNVTNLQWLTAFVLIQQALIARPAMRAQRLADLGIIAIVGLTGPFVIALAPLFAWRWWRDRHRDNLAVLLLVGACAAVQAWFVIKTGPRFEHEALPLQPFQVLTVLARRILVWPAFGSAIALAIPPLIIGTVGGGLITGLLLWALRPHPRREVRIRLVAAFVLLVLAGVFRTRPDTWSGDNLFYADRYFYIPRVLLAWLVILEIDAASRVVAYGARAFCLAVALVHLPDYRLPAPENYEWAKHVEPIRRGVPAWIPTLPEGWQMEYRGRPETASPP